MKIKYLIVQGKTHLVISETDWDGFREITGKIWNFIYSHRGFVLRQYYRESKTAQPCSYYVEEGEDINKGVTAVVFSSPWEDHKSYIDILQRELKLQIENLPE